MSANQRIDIISPLRKIYRSVASRNVFDGFIPCSCIIPKQTSYISTSHGISPRNSASAEQALQSASVTSVILLSVLQSDGKLYILAGRPCGTLGFEEHLMLWLFHIRTERSSSFWNKYNRKFQRHRSFYLIFRKEINEIVFIAPVRLSYAKVRKCRNLNTSC